MTRTEPPPKRKPQQRPSGNRSAIAGLLAVVVIAAALFWLITALVKHNQIQNCIDSGRRDCVPLPGDG